MSDEYTVPPMVSFSRYDGRRAHAIPRRSTTGGPTVFADRVCDYDGLMLQPPSTISHYQERDEDDTKGDSPEFSVCRQGHDAYFDAPHVTKNHPSGMVDIEIVDETEYSHEIEGADPKLRRRLCFHGLCVLGWVTVVVLATVLILQSTHETDVVPTTPVASAPSNGSVPVPMASKKETAAASSGFVVRINAGATQSYTDLNQRVWYPDDPFQMGLPDVYTVTGWGGGSTTPSRQNHTIYQVGVEGPGVYSDERYFAHRGRYEIYVPRDALYHVDLLFAEVVYGRVGDRVFDVVVEDTVVESNFDIVRHAKANWTATRLTRTVKVMDGALTLELVSKVEHAKISGIIVRSLAE